jgi:hypothetical protein
LERLVRRAPHRLDRDRAIGNICTPQQASFALSSLLTEIPL